MALPYPSDLTRLTSALTTLPFPFRRAWLLPADYLFANLVHYQPPVHHTSYHLPGLPSPLFRGQFCSLTTASQHFWTIDVLLDWFTEAPRLKARKGHLPSPLTLWSSDEGRAFLTRQATLVDRLDLRILREFVTGHEVSQFQPTWVKGLLHTVMGTDLKDKKMLDLSAGWGDRLVTALALEMEYVGFDPNIELQPGYNAMIDQFGVAGKQFVVPIPVEHCQMTEAQFDVVVLSPPVWRSEIYSEEPGQASQYPTFESWVTDFLEVAVTKGWACLKPGGWLLFHVPAELSVSWRVSVEKWGQKLMGGSQYEGVIGVGEEKMTPVHVWKKRFFSE